MNPVVSVIIPVYKVEEYLDECIRSVVSQTYPELEIILVDDGSPDHCPQICDSWAKRDNRISVIHKENGGLSDARNAGIDACNGEYIVFVDSDDWIDTDMIRKLLCELTNRHADICCCGIVDVFPERQRIRSTDYFCGNAEQALKRLYQDALLPVSAWNKIYTRSCWSKIRFPKGKICEDAFTTYLLFAMADTIVQIPDVLYFYRIRENSIMTAPFSKARMDEEEAWRENYLYMKTHYPKVYRRSYDFYLKKVYSLIRKIEDSQIAEYKKEYLYLYRILKRNLPYMAILSNLRLKERVKMCSTIIRLRKV